MSLKRIADSIYTLRFINLLNLPWDKTEAYEKGIIDENGKFLKKPKTSDEKDAYSMFHRLVFNIKRIISTNSRSSNRFSSLASSLYLLKENYAVEIDIHSSNLQFDKPNDSQLCYSNKKLRVLTESIFWDNEIIPEDSVINLKKEVAEYEGEKIYECEHFGGSTLYLSETQLLEETNAAAIAISNSLFFDTKRVKKRKEVDYNYIRKFVPGFYTLNEMNSLLTESANDKYIAESLRSGNSVILESKNPTKAKRLILFSHDI